MGDPTGIGPEVVVRALAQRPSVRARIFGDPGVLLRAAARTGLELPPETEVVPVTRLPADLSAPGQPNGVAGRAQVDYLAVAADAAMAGGVAGLVTAPLSKAWAARAGFTFPGATEYLAARSGAPEFAMMLAGPRLRTTLVTTHLALRDLVPRLSPAAIASAAVLTARALQRDFGLARPRVAVAGLNPHAGEGGRLGDEEATLVTPGIDGARRRLAETGEVCDLDGPHVPDVVFRRAAAGEFDAVVALYHDQGLIPVKLLHFHEAVNLTLGLPFVRTSPDHGTAHDIAADFRASPASFLAALDLAAKLTENRRKA